MQRKHFLAAMAAGDVSAVEEMTLMGLYWMRQDRPPTSMLRVFRPFSSLKFAEASGHTDSWSFMNLLSS